MASPSKAGAPRPAGRADFPAFPYPPYDIQLGFMSALYSALDAGGVGLFESPTGTGKTLSLICASLQWLQDQRRREAAEAAARGGGAQQPAAGGSSQGGGGESDDDDAPDWMRGFGERQERERQAQLLERQQRRIARAKQQLLGGGGRGMRPPGAGRVGAAAAAAARAAAAAGDPDAEYLVDDWQSDGEGPGGGSGAGGGGARKRSPGAAGLGGGASSDSGSEGEGGGGMLGEAEELEVPRKRQVIFVSRTHSQLSQFVGELHRTPFADELSLVALGSRKALCINDAVLRLQAPGLINERCLELQRPSAGGSKKVAVAAGGAAGPAGRKAGGARCAYLGAGSAAAGTTRDLILAQPMDIEELGKLGRRKSVCPYYAARRAVPEADIILAPYSCLLVRETREALGLSLEGSVVIVDEGHNLVEAINSSHSAELSEAVAAAAHAQLSAYFARFQSRLAPANCRHIQTLTRATGALARAAAAGLGAAGSGSGGGSAAAAAGGAAAGGGGGQAAGAGVVLTVNAFLLATGLDNLNLFKLVSYVRESKLVHKVAGFWQAQQKRDAAAAAGLAAGGGTAAAAATAAAARAAGTAAGEGEGVGGAGTGPLHALVSFLQALTNADADGRIVVQPAAAAPAAAAAAGAPAAAPAATAGGQPGNGQPGGLLKFVLLNAAAHFGAVVRAAHAVVLASGTLSPLESVLHLFPGLPPHRLHRYACGHVVPRERLLALAVGAGPSGAALDFRHARRGAPATMDELGRLVLNACQVVPGGVVVFFPSFSYAEQVHARWQQTGLLRQLGARKHVFREPRAAADVEACLQQYAETIAACSAGSSASSTAGGAITPPKAAAVVAGLGAAATAGTAAAAAASGGGGGGGGGRSGAVLLCVVGGKLAEGINFGDDLGRCVIMVGLPYPNPSDPELRERMAFMDRLPAAATAAATTDAALTLPAAAGQRGGAQPPAAAQQAVVASAKAGEGGREYYQNLCMKAVNQCIGRVVRHRGDWAAVLLVDARYAAAVDGRGGFTGPLAKLPGWIQQSLQVTRGFGEACGRLARFSRGMAAAAAGGAAAAAGAPAAGGAAAAAGAPAAAAPPASPG